MNIVEIFIFPNPQCYLVMKAGIHIFQAIIDSRLRGNDVNLMIFC